MTRVKYDLTDHLKITSSKDLKAYSVGQLCGMLRRPVSTKVEGHLQTIFTLRQDCIVPSVVNDLGKGYCLTSDSLLPSPIFMLNMEEDSMIQTNFGFMLPHGVAMDPLHDSVTYMEGFLDNNSYVRRRCNLLKINMEVDAALLCTNPKAGFNRIKDAHSKEASFLFEQRLFKLDLTGWQDKKVVGLNHGFIEDVKALPRKFSRHENKGVFQDFFDKWGQFFVVGANGGGSVDVTVSTVGFQSYIFLERADLEETFRNLIHGGSMDEDNR